MRRLAAVVALALATAALATVPVASPAAAVEPGDLTLLAGPDAALDDETGGIQVSVQPGGGVWQSAVVTNRGRQRFTVQFGGSDWLQPAVESVLLEPGQSEAVRFTVAPPAGTEPGNSHAEFTAEVEGTPEVTRSLDLVVTVLAGGSAPVADAETPLTEPEQPTNEVPAAGREPREPKSRTADVVLLAGVLGAIGLLLFGMLIPPLIRLAKNRRRLGLHVTKLQARVHSRVDARRIRRIVEASAATGAVPPMPDKPTRADVKRAEYRRRVAERRAVVREEETRVRDEARRLATALWADRIREARKLAEQEAAERTQRIEAARRDRAELAAALAEERQISEARRIERQRRVATMRQVESTQRAEERATRSAARQVARRAAAHDTAAEGEAIEIQRQRAQEAERNRQILDRSGTARERAMSWGGALDAATRAQAARTPPVAGEDGLRPPPELRAPVAFLDPLTGKVVPPRRPEAEPSVVMEPEPEISERIDVTALDVEALNRQLASAPSQGNRAASAHRRSNP